jgi:4-hydroxy-tetrahydrodipicolinate reductase
MSPITDPAKLPRVSVAGCTGTIGRLCVAAAMESSACRLGGGILRPGHPGRGRDVGELAHCGPAHAMARDDAATVIQASHAVIDFTVPAATILHATLAAEHGVALVAATTGLDGAQEAVLREAARRAPIVRAPNMSLVNAVMIDAVERIARLLDADYDIEVLDQVHRRKRDLPSGTALALGAAAARGRDVDFDEVAVRARDGQVPARGRGSIGLSSTRGGDAAGAFSVYLYGTHDALEITHRVHDRELYAAIALRAALWAIGQPPGLYGLMDVLNSGG